MERDLRKVYATESIISYFENEGSEVVLEYLKIGQRGKAGFPNYSDMLNVMGLIGGTTRDGIKFESSLVSRNQVTDYLRSIRVGDNIHLN